MGGNSSSSQGGSTIEIHGCTPNPCANGGTCAELPLGHACQCTPGHAGGDCQYPVFEGLGNREDCDSPWTFFPTDISGDGLVVVGACQSDVPFRWTEGIGYEELGITGTASGTNRDGSIVVGSTNAQPYRLDWLTRTLTILPNPGSGNAAAISRDDRVVVGRIDDTDGKGVACRWLGSAEPERLGMLPGGLFSSAAAVSSDGSIVAGSSDSGGYVYRAFRWTEADRTMLDLGAVAGTGNSNASGMTGDGSQIVGESFSPAYPGTERAFLWTSGSGMTDLGTLPDYLGAIAVDISSYDPMVAVQLYQLIDAPPLNRAAVWDANHGIRLVTDIVAAAGGDTTGWTLQAIVAISETGSVVVGQGINPSGRSEPWIARLR
jgi:probable HAF family extracellular repeat protein